MLQPRIKLLGFSILEQVVSITRFWKLSPLWIRVFLCIYYNKSYNEPTFHNQIFGNAS